jgi:hypothetical protein
MALPRIDARPYAEPVDILSPIWNNLCLDQGELTYEQQRLEIRLGVSSTEDKTQSHLHDLEVQYSAVQT